MTDARNQRRPLDVLRGEAAPARRHEHAPGRDDLPPLVWVEWVDSTESHGWELGKDVLRNYIVLIVTVGFLVLEDEDMLIVAPHYGRPVKDGHDWQATGAMAIPRRAVVRIAPLAAPASAAGSPA